MTQLALEKWFRETNTCLATMNVIITVRWWGKPSVFPSAVCVISMCVCLIKHQCVSRMPCVVSESACMPCLCVGIVSGLSGHCFPDVVYSLQSDSLLPASVVSLYNLSEVWSTTFNWPAQNWPNLTKPFGKIPGKTKSFLNKELNKATTHGFYHIYNSIFWRTKKQVFF